MTGSRRRRLLVLGAMGLVAPTALPSTGAADATRPAAPTIALVAPMRASVGQHVVIRGRHFSHRTRFSTVVFRGPRGGAALARPVRAFPRKLVVRVPTTVERLMRTADDDSSTALPTRFRLRVVSERRRSKLTGPLRSPLVVPASPEG
jgi:hypothetical protein